MKRKQVSIWHSSVVRRALQPMESVQWGLGITSALLLSLLLFGISPQSAQASRLAQQDSTDDVPIPRSFVNPWQGDEIYTSPQLGAAAVQQAEAEPVDLIIDSDFGVDDVVAVATLLSLHEGIAVAEKDVTIHGIVTVAGVAPVNQAVNNALLLLEQYGLSAEDISVVKGAKKPWKQKLSKSVSLIHGPDSLWWLADTSPKPNTKHVLKNAVNFYCKESELSGKTILAIGPLTNIADALNKCPERFTGTTGPRLVILGGADFGGNQTPVAEYNFWQDSDAAQSIFDFAKPDYIGSPDGPKLDITIIPLDTFSQYAITWPAIEELTGKPDSIARWLTSPYRDEVDDPDELLCTYPAFPDDPYDPELGPLPWYFCGQSGGFTIDPFGNLIGVPIPDLVAAAYVVGAAGEVSTVPAIVDVIDNKKTPELASGQSLIATNAPFFPPGTNEQVLQTYDDKTLGKLADLVFAGGEPFVVDYGPLLNEVGQVYYAPPTNATVVTQIQSASVESYLVNTLGAPFSPELEIVPSNVVDEQNVLPPQEGDTQIFLPMIGSE